MYFDFCFVRMRCVCVVVVFIFFFQAEDGIRDLVRSRGLGDVYKRQFRTTNSGNRFSIILVICLLAGNSSSMINTRML